MIHLVSFVAGAALFAAWPFVPRLAAASLAVLALAISRKSRPAALMLLLGFCLAYVRAPAPPPASWDNPVTLAGYFSEPARAYGSINSQPFVPGARPEGAPAAFNVLSHREFRAGPGHTLRLRMVTPPMRRNPGSWERSAYARLLESSGPDKDWGSPLSHIASLRQGLGTEIDSHLPAKEAALVKAVTIGLRQDMPEGVLRDFRRSGLAHLLSISGTHFGFFAVALFFLIRAALVRMPHRALLAMTMRISPSQAAALLTLPAMLFYLGISGGSPPSIRAFIMIGLFLLGLLLGARGRWQEFLAAAAFLLVLMDPGVIATPSFLMSFSAVLFIGLALRRPSRIEGEERPPEGRAMRALRLLALRPLMLATAATLGVMPLVMHWFGELSIISPLANVAVTALAGLLLIPMSIAGAMTYAAFGVFATAPLVEPLARASLWMVHAMASPRWASLPVPPMPPVLMALYYACVLPWLMTRRRALLPLMILPIIAYSAVAAIESSSREVSMTFLDTGSSDSAVLVLPGRRAVVMDTSRSGSYVSSYLRYLGIKEIEALVLTHSHVDHTGGAERLASRFRIKEVWDQGGIKKKHREGLGGIPVRHLHRGDSIELPGATLSVLHPPEGYRPATGGTMRTNNLSLVLRAEASGGSSVLMTGDIQSEGIEELKGLDAEKLQSDVLKVPHHGKQPEDALSLMGLARPGVSIITGPGVPELDSPDILSTGEHGAVKVSLSGHGPEIKTYAEFAPVRRPGTFSEELHNISTLFTVW